MSNRTVVIPPIRAGCPEAKARGERRWSAVVYVNENVGVLQGTFIYNYDRGKFKRMGCADATTTTPVWDGDEYLGAGPVRRG
jgi:hypothetical protein